MFSKNKFAIVDDDNFLELVKFKWSYSNGYVYRPIKNLNKKQFNILMHRQIMGFPRNKQIDHINHNTLDNRKINLRICSSAENVRNQRLHKDNTWGFKGVSCSNDRKNKRFIARIVFNRKQIFLGRFYSAEDATVVYDQAAKKYFKEFAYVPNQT